MHGQVDGAVAVPVEVIILTVLFLAAIISFTLGFGNALIAMPILSLLIDVKTATPVVAFVTGSISVCILLGNPRAVHFPSVGRLLGAAIAGIPVGLWLLHGPHQELVKGLLAVTIIAFASYKLAKLELPPVKDERLAYVFGFVAGILGAAFNTNGPPVVIYGALRRWPVETFRASLQGFFLPAGLLVMISHGATGLWTGQVLRLTALSLPAVALGMLVGRRIAGRIHQPTFEKCVQILLIVVGVALLAQAIA